METQYRTELWNEPYYVEKENDIFQDYLVSWVDECGVTQCQMMTVKLNAKKK